MDNHKAFKIGCNLGWLTGYIFARYGHDSDLRGGLVHVGEDIEALVCGDAPVPEWQKPAPNMKLSPEPDLPITCTAHNSFMCKDCMDKFGEPQISAQGSPTQKWQRFQDMGLSVMANGKSVYTLRGPSGNYYQTDAVLAKLSGDMPKYRFANEVAQMPFEEHKELIRQLDEANLCQPPYKHQPHENQVKRPILMERTGAAGADWMEF